MKFLWNQTELELARCPGLPDSKNLPVLLSKALSQSLASLRPISSCPRGDVKVAHASVSHLEVIQPEEAQEASVSLPGL